MEGVLVMMIPLLLREDWNPLIASRRVSDHVKQELAPLRETRLHLLTASAHWTTLIDLRAIATLNLAISHLENSSAD